MGSDEEIINGYERAEKQGMDLNWREKEVGKERKSSKEVKRTVVMAAVKTENGREKEPCKALTGEEKKMTAICRKG